MFGRGLLLLDKTMKNHHGGALEAKEYSSNSVFKFDPDLQDLPIILLTARDQELDPRLGALMGIEYLHKSCLPGELIAMVNKVLSSGN